MKSIEPALPSANKWTGYLVAGTSPFGTANADAGLRRAFDIRSDKIFINGGKRGFRSEIVAVEIVRFWTRKGRGVYEFGK